MGIGTLRAVVIDVADLPAAEEFWSEVTGLHLVASNYAERFSILADRQPTGHEVILQARDGKKPDTPNRCHVDITPENGVDRAVEQIIAIGGTLRKAPSIYPRPGSVADRRPVIDWAVMRDPFGNEFCLVTDLTREQSDAVTHVAEQGILTDHELRVAAGVTSP